MTLYSTTHVSPPQLRRADGATDSLRIAWRRQAGGPPSFPHPAHSPLENAARFPHLTAESDQQQENREFKSQKMASPLVITREFIISPQGIETAK